MDDGDDDGDDERDTEDTEIPDYLAPYARAVERFGDGFGSLLIADPSWQEARFAAFARIVGLTGRGLADLGSGRADLLDWLLREGVVCRRYVGVEGLAELDAFARARAENAGWARSGVAVELVHADFVADPELLARLVRGGGGGGGAGAGEGGGVDVLYFGGSLNTLDEDDALAVLDRAWAALADTPGGVLAFNFLADGPPQWSRPPTRLPRRDTQAWFAWAHERTPLVIFAQHYLGAHDATLVMIRP